MSKRKSSDFAIKASKRSESNSNAARSQKKVVGDFYSRGVEEELVRLATASRRREDTDPVEDEDVDMDESSESLPPHTVGTPTPSQNTDNVSTTVPKQEEHVAVRLKALFPDTVNISYKVDSRCFLGDRPVLCKASDLPSFGSRPDIIFYCGDLPVCFCEVVSGGRVLSSLRQLFFSLCQQILIWKALVVNFSVATGFLLSPQDNNFVIALHVSFSEDDLLFSCKGEEVTESQQIWSKWKSSFPLELSTLSSDLIQGAVGANALMEVTNATTPCYLLSMLPRISEDYLKKNHLKQIPSCFSLLFKFTDVVDPLLPLGIKKESMGDIVVDPNGILQVVASLIDKVVETQQMLIQVTSEAASLTEADMGDAACSGMQDDFGKIFEEIHLKMVNLQALHRWEGVCIKYSLDDCTSNSKLVGLLKLFEEKLTSFHDKLTSFRYKLTIFQKELTSFQDKLTIFQKDMTIFRLQTSQKMSSAVCPPDLPVSPNWLEPLGQLNQLADGLELICPYNCPMIFPLVLFNWGNIGVMKRFVVLPWIQNEYEHDDYNENLIKMTALLHSVFKVAHGDIRIPNLKVRHGRVMFIDPDRWNRWDTVDTCSGYDKVPSTTKLACDKDLDMLEVIVNESHSEWHSYYQDECTFYRAAAAGF